MEDRDARRVKRCRVRRWLVGALLGLACALLVGHFVALRFVAGAIVQSPNSGKPIVAAALPPDGVARAITVEVGPPTARISAWVMDPPPRDGATVVPVGTVLVAHGIHSGKRDMTGAGRWLAEAGFRAVLIDLRGHGQSTGDTLSFGVHESRDLSQVVDWLERNGLMAGDLGAYGTSFGAATVLVLAAKDPRIKAVVAVCPFSSMREIVPQYARMYLSAGGWLPDWWIQLAIDRAGQLGCFDPDDASPVQAIRNASAHALVIHGRADANIPFVHSQAIAAAAPDRTRLVLLEEEDHVSIMQDRSGTIRREAIAWFGWYLRGED